MTIVELIESLEEDLVKLFKNSEFETKSSKGTKTPKIKTGWHVAKNTRQSKEDIEKNKEEFPSILITPVVEDETREESSVELLLIFGSYSDDEDGWKDVFSMCEKTRQFLKTNYKVGESFAIKDNFKTHYPDSQPYPTWFCWMNVSFNLYGPVIDSVTAELMGDLL